jgi:GT2 family glycosyltransferase
MTDISIIILSFNGKELLARTLDAVNRAVCSRLAIETIVADNGSTDGSIEMVKQDYEWVKLVENGANLGFSKGNNLGVKASEGRYVLFLNSDTEMSPGVLEYIYDRMEKDASIGIATCKVMLENGEVDPASHRGFPTPWRAFTYYAGMERLAITYLSTSSEKAVSFLKDTAISQFLLKWLGGYHLADKDLNQEHQIDACTGAFMMMRREVGENIDWWSEEYFMYGEDLDICFKVTQLGMKVMYFPEFTILHLKHASGLKKGKGIELSTEEKEKARKVKRKTTEAFYDAMIIFYEKFYRQTYPEIIRLLVYSFVRFKKRQALSKI